MLSVTAFILVHENAGFLEKSARSIAAQTRRPNRCVILVTDTLPETQQAAERWAAEIGTECFASHESLTCAGSKNWAATIALTDVFFTLDADDYLLPDFLRLCIESMEQSGADVTGCEYYQQRDGVIYLNPLAPLSDLYSGNPLPSCSLIRTASFWKTRGYRDLLYDDWALWIALHRLDCRLERIAERLMVYVRHGAALTQPEKHDYAMQQLNAYVRGLP